LINAGNNPQDEGYIGNETQENELKMTPTDIVHEYNIVKQMLINNSLPISQGTIDSSNNTVFSRKLIIDKKIIHSLLIDLQRFRKLLNIKKSLFIFNISYDGKPASMKKWHEQVEVRVT